MPREAKRGEETHVVVDESVVIGDKSDCADDCDKQCRAPRDGRPEQGACDGKECRVGNKGEYESKGHLVLRLIFLESIRGGVAGEEVDGKVDDEREEEERKADEACEGGKNDRAEDAHARGEGMRHGGVECGGQRER